MHALCVEIGTCKRGMKALIRTPLQIHSIPETEMMDVLSGELPKGA